MSGSRSNVEISDQHNPLYSFKIRGYTISLDFLHQQMSESSSNVEIMDQPIQFVVSRSVVAPSSLEDSV